MNSKTKSLTRSIRHRTPSALRAFLPITLTLDWIDSRSYRKLLLGLPAVFIACATLVGAVLAAIPRKQDTPIAYIALAIDAEQKGQAEVAKLYMRKAVSTHSGSEKERFEQALALAAHGQLPEAIQIMQDLAPLDRPGHVPAREWLINWHTTELAKDLKDPTEQTDRRQQTARSFKLVESHAKSILGVDEENALALEKLTLIMMNRGEMEKAKKYLERLVVVSPEFYFLYAQYLDAKGDRRGSESAIKKAIRFIQRELKKSGLSAKQRKTFQTRLATSLSYKGDYDQAVQVLLERNQLPTDPGLRATLGNVFFAWSHTINMKTAGEDANLFAQKLDYLVKAALLRPNDERILLQIASVSGAKGAAGEKARKALRELLASGTAPDLAHFVLGISSMMAGDEEGSLKHLELANRSRPNTPITLNNLAFLLARRDPPDLVRALALVNKAIEMRPELIGFYDTRGGIYILMESWALAIADLERALKAKAGDVAEMHRMLAKAYGELGDSELAKIHKDLSAK